MWSVFFEKSLNEIANLDQDLQEEKNEREAWVRQHNQLMIHSQ